MTDTRAMENATPRTDAIDSEPASATNKHEGWMVGYYSLLSLALQLETELTAARLDAKSWSDQCSERVKDWDAMRERADAAKEEVKRQHEKNTQIYGRLCKAECELAALRKRIEEAGNNLPSTVLIRRGRVVENSNWQTDHSEWVTLKEYEHLKSTATALLAQRNAKIAELRPLLADCEQSILNSHEFAKEHGVYLTGDNTLLRRLHAALSRSSTEKDAARKESNG